MLKTLFSASLSEEEIVSPLAVLNQKRQGSHDVVYCVEDGSHSVAAAGSRHCQGEERNLLFA